MFNILIKSMQFVWKLNYKNSFNEEIIKLNNIDIPYPLIFKEFDSLLSKKETFTKKKSELKASKHFIAYIYYSIYESLDLYNKNIEDYENNEIVKNILKIAIKYHYHYLSYKSTISGKESLFEKSSLGIIRIIEILLALETKYNHSNFQYIKELYFPSNSDFEMIFFDTIENNTTENKFYFIKEATNKKKNFIVYDNKNLDLYLQIESCRPTKKGSQIEESNLNTNIIHHILNSYDPYKKLLNLEEEKSSPKNPGTRDVFSTLQDTEEEELLKKTTVSNKEPSINLEVEDSLDQNTKRKRFYRTFPRKDDKDNVPDLHKQKLRSIAFSANITKNILLLKSSYNIPPILIFKNFLKIEFENTREDRNLLYDIVFLIDALLGIGYTMIINLIVKKKNSKVSFKKPYISVKLDESLFSKQSNLFISKDNNKIIKFYIPEKFELLIEKAHSIINENQLTDLHSQDEASKYFKYIKNIIKKHQKKISFDPRHMWKIISTYIKDYEKEDMTHLFCIGKYQPNSTPKLSYTSTPQYAQKHNRILDIYYKKFDYQNILTNLLELEKSEVKQYSEFSSLEPLVGSRIAVNKEKSIEFFEKIKHEIEYNSDERLIFNLTSIYTRYALSLLILTRPYEFSASLSRYSKLEKILIITEKATTLLSGIRMIPLCNKAVKIIENYKRSCQKMNIPSDNIYLVNDDGHMVYTHVNSEKILKTTSFHKIIEDFINNVPLNTGRHVFVKEAAPLLSLNYIETVLGHYSIGGEQLGIYSSMHLPSYRSQTSDILEKIGESYGV